MPAPAACRWSLPDATGAYGFGLPANEQAIARALEGFDFDAGAALELDLSPQAGAVLDAMLAKGFASAHRGAGLRIGHDPIGASRSAHLAHAPVD